MEVEKLFREDPKLFGFAEYLGSKLSPLLKKHELSNEEEGVLAIKF